LGLSARHFNGEKNTFSFQPIPLYYAKKLSIVTNNAKVSHTDAFHNEEHHDFNR